MKENESFKKYTLYNLFDFVLYIFDYQCSRQIFNYTITFNNWRFKLGQKKIKNIETT